MRSSNDEHHDAPAPVHHPSRRRGSEADMRWMIVLAVLLAAPAEAAPIELSCQGQTNVYDKGSFSPTAETLSVTLDFAAGTVTVANRAGRWTVPMVNRPNEDMVTLAH